MRSHFYLTTPIYYVNDVPHIGHAYTTIAADVMARFRRLMGDEVFFLTGTDEHGQKIEKAAAEKGEAPKQLADRVMIRFRMLWERLNISNDYFIRTTDSNHYEAVQTFFKKVREKGDIYLGQYEDWYCIFDEAYWTEFQLVDGKCPTCGRPVEKLKEESYFFRMSQYQNRLLRHLKTHPDFIQPKSRRNEVIRFVEGGLRDLSISRVSFRWGIPLPDDERHVIYVWFDALTNYLTALGYGKDPKRFKRFWPADLHLIGKDILRFHTVYWPCFLFAAGLPLPKMVFAHGWWTVEGEKMSKSKGNVVDPNLMADRYGVDAFRYFLLREVPFGEDGDFSEKALRHRINSELANDLGNLASRVIQMIGLYAQGRVPKPPSRAQTVQDERLRKQCGHLYRSVAEKMDRLAFHQALRAIWKVVDLANRYVEATAPWNLAKNPKRAKRLSTVLYNLAETLRLLSLYLYPFMPKAMEELVRQLGLPDYPQKAVLAREYRWGRLKPGTRVEKGPHLFPRIEKEKTEMPIETKPEQAIPNRITLEEFRKLDLRVGKIQSAETVPGSDKLLKLQVDIGTEVRQVVAGIATRYRPEELIGQSVILVANLKPAVIRGVESQGMILAAGDKEVEALAVFLEDVKPGTPVK
jgi:methionyl-tRNA synthetase